ncbi:MAG: MATE family efflux transporter [Spirochaetes bacterium]|nr:MATE family efflux transporter [Spirochaetota bacterium]
MNSIFKRWSAEGGYKQVLLIAFPLILSTGTMTIQHFVDRMFLAWYSTETIAAAMPAGMLNFAITSLFLGLSGYVSVFIAQYYGAGKNERVGAVLWQGFYISITGGLLIFLLIPVSEPLFNFIGHDPAVRKHEIIYFKILCMGGFPGIASSALSGFFSGRGKPWPVLWINIISTVINLIFDYLLIFGKMGFPELGIKGAGIATLLGTVVSFMLTVIFLLPKSYRLKYHILKAWKFEKKLFLRVIKYGMPAGIQFMVDMGGFSIFILLVGRLGTQNLAATNIAFNINSLVFMPMMGAGTAISVLVGQFLGKNKPELAQYSTYSGFQLTFIYIFTIALAYVVIPDIFISPFATKTDPESFTEIHGLIVVLLRFVAVYSIFDNMNIVFSSAIKGAGDTRFVMFMIMLLTPCVLIIPTFLLVVIFKMNILATWIVASAYVVCLGLGFFLRFLGGKWKKMRVI